MYVDCWGTRGSLPVSDKAKMEFGGNTTCYGIRSATIPENMALCVDAGSGFLPFSMQALKQGVKQVHVLQTHYHHDHTQGMLIAPPIYLPWVGLHIYGTEENRMGPKDVYARIMEPPLHPVSLKEVEHHVTFKRLGNPGAAVFAVHPVGGMKLFHITQYLGAESNGRYLQFRRGEWHPIAECMIISMHKTEHPEKTIAYRFQDNPSGRTVTILTDEEVRASIPVSLKQFLEGTHLLIQDVQYTVKEYMNGKGGYGHGTPEYAVRLAKEVGVTRVGFTHHDPQSSDEKVREILAEAQEYAHGVELEVFAARDYDILTV